MYSPFQSCQTPPKFESDISQWIFGVTKINLLFLESPQRARSFGTPRPTKFQKVRGTELMEICSILNIPATLIVLKKKYYRSCLCYCPPITTTTPLLPFVTLPPPPTLYPFHLMLIVGSLLFWHQTGFHPVWYSIPWYCCKNYFSSVQHRYIIFSLPITYFRARH
jgi:hypothetical protein